MQPICSHVVAICCHISSCSEAAQLLIYLALTQRLTRQKPEELQSDLMGCSLRRAQAGGCCSDGGVAAHGEEGACQQGGGHP